MFLRRMLLKFTLIQDINREIYRRKWRKLNKNNFTIAKSKFDFNKVEVGEGTYGEIDVRSYGIENEKLKIGRYCSIAKEVTFLLSGEHLYNKLSTYPFKKKLLNIDESFSKGEIILDDDVWIGHGATILSGVHICQGAVIGAKSLVTKDIPPYAVVGGIPAKIIKYRFSKKIIDKLTKVDFSEIDTKQIGALYENVTEENIDKLIYKVFNKT